MENEGEHVQILAQSMSAESRHDRVTVPPGKLTDNHNETQHEA